MTFDPVAPAPPNLPCLLLSLQEIVDWFDSIRAVQLRYLQVAFPGATDAEVSTCVRTFVALLLLLLLIIVETAYFSLS